MKFLHTPGPWHISSHEDNSEIVIRDDKSLTIVANLQCDAYHIPYDELAANARLMAMCPEIFKALIDLHKRVTMSDLAYCPENVIAVGIISKTLGGRP
jgi:hypothetical protein